MDPRPEVQTIYNSLIFFAPDGTVLGRHRKLMPTFTERLFWGQGDARDLVVFDTDIGRLGGLICGEHVMTLARACLIAQGEDIHVAAEFPYKGRRLSNSLLMIPLPGLAATPDLLSPPPVGGTSFGPPEHENSLTDRQSHRSDADRQARGWPAERSSHLRWIPTTRACGG
jgi:hypothetical protein